jgi:hypothetical protein
VIFFRCIQHILCFAPMPFIKRAQISLINCKEHSSKLCVTTLWSQICSFLYEHNFEQRTGNPNSVQEISCKTEFFRLSRFRSSVRRVWAQKAENCLSSDRCGPYAISVKRSMTAVLPPIYVILNNVKFWLWRLNIGIYQTTRCRIPEDSNLQFSTTVLSSGF